MFNWPCSLRGINNLLRVIWRVVRNIPSLLGWLIIFCNYKEEKRFLSFEIVFLVTAEYNCVPIHIYRVNASESNYYYKLIMKVSIKETIPNLSSYSQKTKTFKLCDFSQQFWIPQYLILFTFEKHYKCIWKVFNLNK